MRIMPYICVQQTYNFQVIIPSRLHNCCSELEGGPYKSGKQHTLGGCSYYNLPPQFGP